MLGKLRFDKDFAIEVYEQKAMPINHKSDETRLSRFRRHISIKQKCRIHYKNSGYGDGKF